VTPEVQYARACFPAPWTILGVQLERFTLAHLLALQSIDSPLLGTGPVTLGALTVAVWVCAQPHALAGALHQPLPWRWRWWALQLRWLRHRCPGLVESRAELLRQYLADAVAWPRYWRQPTTQDSRPLSAPHALVVKQSLICDCGYTPEAALALPVSQAHWEYAALLEREGIIKLRSRDDDEVSRMLEQLEQTPANG
jgi:hypothetical protein